MKMVLVDDERLILEDTSQQCLNIENVQIVGAFCNPFEALDYIERHDVDCILIDIEMPGINGISFAKRVNALARGIVIIFVTGYSEYALEAFQEYALGYLMKPVHKDKLQILLNKAMVLQKNMNENLTIQTFDHFDIFLGHQVILFKSAKAKELLAVCISQNGGTIEMDEIIGKLWPDRPYDERVKGLYRKAILNLRKTLESYQIEDLFFSARGLCYVSKVSYTCDLFLFMEGKEKQNYKGQFMSEYEWAEDINYELSKLV